MARYESRTSLEGYHGLTGRFDCSREGALFLPADTPVRFGGFLHLRISDAAIGALGQPMRT